MAVGLASGVANSLLDAICNATNYTAPTGFYVKLHTADPGAAGATAAAGETTRQSASMAAAAAGAITNDAAVSWVAVSTTETVSHLSFWSAAAAGTFLASSALTVARALTAGDTFTLATGDIDISLVIIAA